MFTTFDVKFMSINRKVLVAVGADGLVEDMIIFVDYGGVMP